MSSFFKLIVLALFLLAPLSPAAAGYSGAAQAYTVTLPIVVWPSNPSLAALQLAIIIDDDLYVMQADGSHKLRLTNDPPREEELAWSPDGQKIAYTAISSSDTNIAVVNVDGSGQTYLTSGLATNSGPVWSPDGAKILFTSTRDGYRELYLMNADGSQQTRLTMTSADEFCPIWSPDGSRIAFVSNRDGRSHIYLMNADGSEQTRLTTSSNAEGCPAWSPDGTRIAFVSRGEDYTSDLDVLRLDNGVRTHLCTIGYTPWGGVMYALAWSPDSTQIAFNRTLSEYPLRLYRDFVYLIKADGSEALPRMITTGMWPDWSPDGMWLVYTRRYFHEGLGHYLGRYIEAIHVDGTQRTRLTEEENAFGPRWAPQRDTSD